MVRCRGGRASRRRPGAGESSPELLLCGLRGCPASLRCKGEEPPSCGQPGLEEAAGPNCCWMPISSRDRPSSLGVAGFCAVTAKNWVMSGERRMPLPRTFSHPIEKLQTCALGDSPSSAEREEDQGICVKSLNSNRLRVVSRCNTGPAPLSVCIDL